MKNSILFVLLFVGLLSVASAQSPDRYGLRVSYSASGVVFNYQSSSFSGETDSRLSFNISLVAEWDLQPWLVLGAEPGWARRGYKRDITTFFFPFGSMGGSQVQLEYLTLPVLARIKPASWKLAPYLEAGPRLDILLSRTIEDTGAGSYERAVFEEYNSITGGVSLGAGLELARFSPVCLSGGYRLNLDIFNSYSDEAITVRNRSSGLWIGLTYAF
jgi:hypothetical protein